MLTRMKENGQVMIPSEIRKSLRLSKDLVLSIARIGEGILLIPKPSVFESTAAKFSKAAKEKDITLESLLKDFKKNRKTRVTIYQSARLRSELSHEKHQSHRH